MGFKSRRSQPVPPAAEGGPVLCPACRLELRAGATACPHCHSDFSSHPFWTRAGVYVPALSLIAAIVGMTPTLIDAVSRAMNPPVARVVVTDVDLARSGLSVDLANFGQEMGVLAETAVCRLDPASIRIELHLTGSLRLSLPPAATARIDFDDEAAVIVWKDTATPTIMLSDAYPMTEARRYFARDVLDRIESGTGESLVPDNRFTLICRIGVDGNNGPEPVLLTFEIEEGAFGDDIISYRLDQTTP
jgi:hypothetical protein